MSNDCCTCKIFHSLRLTLDNGQAAQADSTDVAIKMSTQCGVIIQQTPCTVQSGLAWKQKNNYYTSNQHGS